MIYVYLPSLSTSGRVRLFDKKHSRSEICRFAIIAIRGGFKMHTSSVKLFS